MVTFPVSVRHTCQKAKESLHPWVKVDQLQPKRLSILEDLTLD